LLDGCLKSNEEHMALKCYQNMKKLKIRPSNVTYSILAKIYQKLCDFEKVFSIIKEMKEEGVKPGVFVYTCLI
jgi:pentatricopeptide repeat protein